ncbi:MAG: tetratricopeptide repeat protein [Myxococcales bacterium]|nr:tetratricopeptide repeat protein [Myxococcales bacterium]MCB9578612.1 tetratricopeptide repeat protein [Polyangiaceae bacterium]
MTARRTFASLALMALVVLLPAVARSDASQEVQDLYRTSYREEAKGKATAALDAMKKIQTKSGATYFVSARQGWLAYLAGRFGESEAAYRAAIKSKPDSIEARLGLTLPLLAQKKWRPLEKACRDVLKLDAQNAVARARLAHAYYSIGNYPDSATVYRKLVRDYPAELDHQTGLGWALARMGRAGEAKKIFAEVLAVSPDNPNARQGMALP